MSNDSIPPEFMAKQSQETVEIDEDGVMANLFADHEDGSSAIDEFENVTIAGQVYKLKLPPDVGTLFAHRVWSGSKLLANYLATNAEKLVKNRKTIEFGAGSALPSLVALAQGSSFTMITDYPDSQILQAIRETVGMNWMTCDDPKGRVRVLGHEWGTDVDDLISCLPSNPSELETYHRSYFDLAILSECLWMHRCHQALAASLDKILHPTHGVAILTYAHHIPGLEKDDDAFFDICERYHGLRIIQKTSHEMEYMWDSSKTITVFLVLLDRVSGDIKKNCT